MRQCCSNNMFNKDNKIGFSALYIQKNSDFRLLVKFAVDNELIKRRKQRYFDRYPCDDIKILEENRKIKVAFSRACGVDEFLPSKAHKETVKNVSEAQVLLHQIFNYINSKKNQKRQNFADVLELSAKY